MPEPPPIRTHQDPALFREAVNYTAAETGFPSRLIEKDYFCTVLLQHLAGAECGLVFKGGTCLAKVHAGFYRLSEDLDFVIATPVDASRAERSRRAAESKAAVAEIAERLPGIRVIAALTGANASTQYIGVIGYTSLLGRQEETIKIEVGLQRAAVDAHNWGRGADTRARSALRVAAGAGPDPPVPFPAGGDGREAAGGALPPRGCHP